MAADDGNGHDDAGREVWDPFAWFPASTEARQGRSIDVPRDFSDAVNARLTAEDDDALLPKLCELLRARDHARVADKVRAMAGHHFAAVHFYGRSAKLAVRRRRIARILEAAASLEDTYRDAVLPALEDDREFVGSEAGKATLVFFRTAIEAYLLLTEEQSKYRTEEEAKQLTAPGKGNHARAAITPTRTFLLLAEILWMQETRTPIQKYSNDYLFYLQLVWELVTGEPERSFAKAIRSHDKVVERFRTRHKR